MSLIFSILISLTIIIMILSVPVSILFALKAIFEKDYLIKKSLKKKVLWIFFGPILCMIILLTAWGLIQAIIKI